MSVDRTFKCKSHPCSPALPEMTACKITVRDTEENSCTPDACPWGYGATEFEEEACSGDFRRLRTIIGV